MPLTPLHLGPGLLIGLLLLSYIDFPTFLVASIIVDVEPILILVLGLGYPLHRFLHSFLGGTLVALVLAVVMCKAREPLSPLLSSLKLEQRVSFRSILLASLLGDYIHILLDSRTHEDVQPFYPLSFNPFLGQSSMRELEVYVLCVWCFIAAAGAYGARLFLAWRKQGQART